MKFILFFLICFTLNAKTCLTIGEKEIAGGVPGPNGWVLPTPCCKGLTDRAPIDICGKGITGGYHYVCLACGDGKCDKNHESKCNCPEDCQMISLPKKSRRI